ERRMTEVMRKTDGLGQGFIEPQSQSSRARDLRYFDRMCDAGAIQVALMVDEHLRLVDETAKRIRVDDPIAIALKLAAESRFRLRIATAARPCIVRGVWCQRTYHRSRRVHTFIRSRHSRCAAARPRSSHW